MSFLISANGNAQVEQLRFVTGDHSHLLIGPFVMVDVKGCNVPVANVRSGPKSTVGGSPIPTVMKAVSVKQLKPS